jgi:thiol-disulfide isomerase/thioredoxin
MKKMMILLLLALPFTGICQQQKFKVKGQITGLSNKTKAYLVYKKVGQFVTDSCRVTGGAFEFSGVCNEPQMATLILGHRGTFVNSGSSDAQTIYLENGMVMIAGKDSLGNARVWGTPLNVDNQEKLKLMKSMVTSKQSEEAKLMSNFVVKHPGSRVSLDWMSDLGGRDNAVIAVYPKLAEAWKNTKAGRELGLTIKTSVSLRPGKPAPDFALPDQNGRLITLSDFRGKFVLLDFWASWCKPCRALQPELIELQEALKSTGKFVILSVSKDKNKAAWLKAIEQDKVTWPQVADLEAVENRAALLYDVRGIPASFLIGPDGKILSKRDKLILMKEKKLPLDAGGRSAQGIGRLSTLDEKKMEEALEKEALNSAGFKRDYQLLDSMLNTDIGESALAGELDKLDIKKDSAAFFHLFHTQSVALARQKFKMQQHFIAGHPDAFVSLYQLNGLEDTYTADGYIAAFNSLSDRLKHSGIGKGIEARLEKYKNTLPGRAATDFSRKNQHGKPVRLSDYRGKLVILDFWGSWCVPCRQSHPHLKELYAKYKSKGLEIVAVANEKNTGNIESAKKAWLAAIKKDDINWVHVLNTEETDTQDIAKAYDIASYPTKLLLDKDGKILMRISGAMSDKMDLMIGKLLDK